MTDTLLQLKDVHVQYGGVKALDDVSVEIDEGEVVALMGPNGAGKSTVLKAIFGLAPIAKGKVLWHEHPVAPRPDEMVARGLSFVPQGRRVFRRLTVQENLEIGGYVIKDKKLVQERIKEVSEIFPDLKTKLKAKSGTLSGGQQQMLAIARGLITEPKVLLLDEPSLGLSPKLVKEVFAKIKEINERHKTAIMVVEHNLKSLLQIVHRAYVLDKGRLVGDGPAAQFAEKDFLKKVFLGQVEAAA
ncbi:MAG: ABC transporter ATP-binding protein [Patescibacteria group bacterium]|nr:ABC transporter ATP-binding protein [Patescibacteria group bacterium]